MKVLEVLARRLSGQKLPILSATPAAIVAAVVYHGIISNPPYYLVGKPTVPILAIGVAIAAFSLTIMSIYLLHSGIIDLWRFIRTWWAGVLEEAQKGESKVGSES